MAVQRAEDKTAQMQARAGAIDELIASGALDDASSHQPRRRHLPRARVAVLAVRRRVRAGGAEGRFDVRRGPAGPGVGRRHAPRRRSRRPRSPSPARRRARHDRAHPGRGPVGRSTSAHVDALNTLDDEVETAVTSGDRETFAQALDALLNAVRTAGCAAARRLAARLRADPAARRRDARGGAGAARRRRADPGLMASYPLHQRPRAHRPDDPGDVPARRAVRRADRRLDVRRRRLFGGPASRSSSGRRPRHRLVPVVQLRLAGPQGDAGQDGDAGGGARAARRHRPALRPRRHAQAPRGDRLHRHAQRVRHRPVAEPLGGLRDDRHPRPAHRRGGRGRARPRALPRRPPRRAGDDAGRVGRHRRRAC